ncbi:MAG: ATP-binding protein, partial [Vicinamibacterales bacterium]
MQIKPDLVARNVFREIPLGFLGVGELERYLDREFPGHMFPSEFVRVLHARTEGSPLFIVDLVRYLRDRQAIGERNGRWVLEQSVPEIQRELPDSVRGTITRNIERLDEIDRKLLLAASVQGHEFDSAVVAEAAGFDPADVEERFESLDRIHGLVRGVGASEFPDLTLSVRYRFVHVLYQNVLYGTLQPSRKASLSAKVGASLCTHYGDRASELASELALLFEAARDLGRAARFFLTAARRAAGIFAFREAGVLSGRGLAAVALLPDGPDRQQLELGLQMVLGLSRRSLEGWAAPDVEPIYVRARQLCHELGDGPRLFPVLWGLALFHAIRGDFQVFLELSEHLLVIAQAQQNPFFEMAAHQMAGAVREFRGETIQSSAHFEHAIELHDPARHAEYTATFGLDPGIISRSLSVRPLWFLGHPDRALARSLDTVALARQLRQPISLVFATCMKVDLHLQRHEPEDLLATVEEQISLCREYGLAQELEWGRMVQGVCLAETGHLEEGLAQMRDSLAIQDRMRAGLLRPTFLTLLAGALLRAGRTREGLDEIERAFEWAERTGEHYYRAEAWRVRGELLGAVDRRPEADSALAEAARLAAA